MANLYLQKISWDDENLNKLIERKLVLEKQSRIFLWKVCITNCFQFLYLTKVYKYYFQKKSFFFNTLTSGSVKYNLYSLYCYLYNYSDSS